MNYRNGPSNTIQYCLTPANCDQGATGFGATGTNPTWTFTTPLRGTYDFAITSNVFSSSDLTDNVIQIIFGQLQTLGSGQQPYLLFSPYNPTIPRMFYEWKVNSVAVNGILSFSITDYLNGSGGSQIAGMNYLIITMDYQQC